MIDGCGRTIDHLRLSVTDHCNLACQYCSAAERQGACRIDAAFAVALVRWLSSRHGVRHVRLTGGEPLLHPDLTGIVADLSTLDTLDEITLTTNGQALAGKARSLRQAGLTRVNVSLDTLDAHRFARLTRGGALVHTLRGIEAALDAGLTPVRLNAVVQRGFNDDELCDLTEWGLARGCTVRFLEMMPIGPRVDDLQRHLVPASEILARLSHRFTLEPIPAPPGQPATDYAARTKGSGVFSTPGSPWRPGSRSEKAMMTPSPRTGVIGVITSTTRPFCARCRRLRITAGGEILSCLFDTGGSSLAAAWNGRALDDEAADRILQAAVIAKPQMGRRVQKMPMIAIGG